MVMRGNVAPRQRNKRGRAKQHLARCCPSMDSANHILRRLQSHPTSFYACIGVSWLTIVCGTQMWCPLCHRTLVGEQDLLIQVQGVLCSVGRECESFSQACSSKLETLHPLEGDPGCLPLWWSFVYLRFLHSLYYPVDSGSVQDTGILAENLLGSSKTKMTWCSS